MSGAIGTGVGRRDVLAAMGGLGLGAATAPRRASAQAGAGAPAKPPNVVLILADDSGFSDLGGYGGEIATPNLDLLAGNGLRFTRMYSTARCWPSRACLLTGYYYEQTTSHDFPPRRPPPARDLAPAFARDGAVPFDYLFFRHTGKALMQGDLKIVSAKSAGDDWQLYDLSIDRCEQRDLSTERPETKREMVARWNALYDGFSKQASGS